MFEHMKEIRKAVGSDTIVVSLSLGKDSIATLALCSMVFKNIYCFVAEMLPKRMRDRQYAEYIREFFPNIRKINFYPHPVFVKELSNDQFKLHTHYKDPFYENGEEEPEGFDYDYSYETLKNHLLLESGIDPTNIYQAVGVKMSDSLNRRISLNRIGYVNYKEKIVYPVRDFTTNGIYNFLKYKGIKLNPDYEFYGSSFDGISAKYWVNAYRKDPETWEMITAYNPMAKAYVYKDLFKRQML